MNLEQIQSALREQQVDGWLFYDHHHRDPIAYRILGLSDTLHVSRRWYYFIPAEGPPRKLTHRVESGKLASLPGSGHVYSSWQELEAGLRTMLEPYQKLAMQYSPRNAIMYVSLVDAGTIEVLRDMGKTIVSSADLVSRFEAVLTPGADRQPLRGPAAHRRNSQCRVEAHRYASALRRCCSAERIRSNGVVAGGDAPRGNSRGLWAECLCKRQQLRLPLRTNLRLLEAHQRRRFPAYRHLGTHGPPGTCFYDITWTGVVGREPNERERQVFSAVAQARDAAIKTVQDAFAAGKPLAGWQADDAARAVIRNAGFGEYFTHRTGHSISTETHGNGANLDNLETHDERLILPYTCFSVEPGIYLPEFGVRSEINMLTEPGRAVVTGPIQAELVRI